MKLEALSSPQASCSKHFRCYLCRMGSLLPDCAMTLTICHFSYLKFLPIVLSLQDIILARGFLLRRQKVDIFLRHLNLVCDIFYLFFYLSCFPYSTDVKTSLVSERVRNLWGLILFCYFLKFKFFVASQKGYFREFLTFSHCSCQNRQSFFLFSPAIFYRQ